MVPGNGTGWKVAGVLAAILCAAVGLLAGSVSVYENHVRVSNQETDRAIEADTRSSSERTQFRSDITDLKNNEKILAEKYDQIMYALNWLCYKQTGQPCPEPRR